MLGNAIQPEIRELIEARNFATLKRTILEMEIHDLTELLSELEGEEVAVVFRLLSTDQAADIFGDLPIEQQEKLIKNLSSERVTELVKEMPPDERTELFEELPGRLAQKLLATLKGDQLQVARSLLNYPEDSIGRLMTPEYVAVRVNWTTDQVLQHIRKVGADKETLNVIYVVDDNWHLLDELRLEQIVLAESTDTVIDMMDEQVAALRANEDQESAIEEFKKYEAVALPVVDSHGILVGIVTVDDVLELAEEEDTEDFQKMAAVNVLESSYLNTSSYKIIMKRLPWLIFLFLAETLTVKAIGSYENKIEHTTLLLLAIFVPLINSCAGNTGSQMAGLMIRGLAIGEVELVDWWKVLLRELTRGLILGGLIGLMGFVTVLIFGKTIYLAIGVSLTLLIVMTLANLLGSLLPFFFKRIGVDPAVTSGPFIASLMDVSAIMIFYTIALSILHNYG